MKKALLILFSLLLSQVLQAQSGPCAPLGEGTFVDSNQALGSLTTGSIVLGDIDDDGDLDMVTGEIDLNHVYFNDGAGNFIDSGQEVGFARTMCVALGDLDGDGDLDLATANIHAPGMSPANTISFNDGNGNFTDSGQLLGAFPSQWLGLADLDGDGDLDMLVANGSSVNGPYVNQVYTNDGSGNFTDTGQSLGVGITHRLTLGDVDGDGDIDFIDSGALGGEPAQIFLNDGNGIFTASGSALPDPSHPLGLLVGDVDDDGDQDIIAAKSWHGTWVWFNDGNGDFSDSSLIEGSEGSFGQSLGDIDGDGDLDLVQMHSFPGIPGSVFHNDGSGLFTLSDQPLGQEQCVSVALGDLDDDGDLDLAVASMGGPDRVYFNEYDGPDCNLNGIPDICELNPATDLNFDGILDSCQGFVRGECNTDGAIDLADGIFLIGYLFIGNEMSSCAAACDVNDDGAINVADAIFSLTALFAGGDPPPAPFPFCGVDTTDDPLECASYNACP